MGQGIPRLPLLLNRLHSNLHHPGLAKGGLRETPFLPDRLRLIPPPSARENPSSLAPPRRLSLSFSLSFSGFGFAAEETPRGEVLFSGGAPPRRTRGKPGGPYKRRRSELPKPEEVGVFFPSADELRGLEEDGADADREAPDGRGPLRGLLGQPDRLGPQGPSGPPDRGVALPAEAGLPGRRPPGPPRRRPARRLRAAHRGHPPDDGETRGVHPDPAEKQQRPDQHLPRPAFRHGGAVPGPDSHPRGSPERPVLPGLREPDPGGGAHTLRLQHLPRGHRDSESTPAGRAEEPLGRVSPVTFGGVSRWLCFSSIGAPGSRREIFCCFLFVCFLPTSNTGHEPKEEVLHNCEICLSVPLMINIK